jgi:hypothetical protein
MSAAVHQLWLSAGETIDGVWHIDDGAVPTPAPMPPVLATCVVWREIAEPIDWSAHVAKVAPADLTLAVPGTATAELAAGRWTCQVWAAFAVDVVPDVLIATIDLRLSLGLPPLVVPAVTGVLL